MDGRLGGVLFVCIDESDVHVWGWELAPFFVSLVLSLLFVKNVVRFREDESVPCYFSLVFFLIRGGSTVLVWEEGLTLTFVSLCGLLLSVSCVW